MKLDQGPFPEQSEIVPRRCIIASQMREHGFSGVQIHAVAVKQLLLDAGWSVEFVTPFTGRGLFRPVLFGIRYLLRPLSRQAAIFWLRFGHNVYLRLALKKALMRDKRPAVIYAQDTLSAETALRIRRNAGDKVVLVVHFNDSQASEWSERGEIPKDGLVYKQIQALEHKVLPRVDTLVYVSRYMQTRLEKQVRNVDKVPASIIPNFVQVPLVNAGAEDADLITIGTLELRKNQAYIVRVIAALRRRGREVTANVLGDGEQRQALEKLSHELGVQHLVRFRGYQTNAAGWLYRHKLLMHAAYLENCPVSLVEALATGTPVIAAAVGGIPELVDETTGAVCDLASVEDGADCVQRLLDNDALRRERGENGRMRYLLRLSPERAGTELVSRFQQLLADDEPRPSD